MPTETLHFDNPRLTSELFNHDVRNLAALEAELGVKAVARDAWIRLDGEAEQIAHARRLFQMLEGRLKAGGVVRNQDFLLALGILKDEGAAALEALQTERIQTSPRKAVVSPKTPGQRHYIEAIRRHDITFGLGPAGTGKTYLAVACAVDALEREQVRRILLVRPAVEAGEKLGFLPGDLTQKIDPYLRPLYDALYEMLGFEQVAKLIEKQVIEVAPLAYMRGRTLNNSFIILDESQNTTVEQMKMFLTRIGFGSTAVITGDITQVDLPRGTRSGLAHVIDVLRDVPGIAFTHFKSHDVVRHPLVQRIVEAYDRYDNRTQAKPRPADNDPGAINPDA